MLMVFARFDAILLICISQRRTRRFSTKSDGTGLERTPIYRSSIPLPPQWKWKRMIWPHVPQSWAKIKATQVAHKMFLRVTRDTLSQSIIKTRASWNFPLRLFTCSGNFAFPQILILWLVKQDSKLFGDKAYIKGLLSQKISRRTSFTEVLGKFRHEYRKQALRWDTKTRVSA